MIDIRIDDILRRFVKGENIKNISLQIGCEAQALGASLEVLALFVDDQLADQVRRKKRKVRKTPVDRFWDFVMPEPNTGCWIWMGTDNGNGYGQHNIGYKKCYPHRFAYELLVGPIPVGMTLDHVCVTPICCNPDHLVPVTATKNNTEATRRRRIKNTHCVNGHEFNEKNTAIRYIKADNAYNRECKICRYQRHRLWRESKKAEIKCDAA